MHNESFIQECIELILEQFQVKDPLHNICFLAYLISSEEEPIDATNLSRVTGLDKDLVEKMLYELQEIGILGKNLHLVYDHPSSSSNLSTTYLSNLSKPERMIFGLVQSLESFPILEIEKLLKIPPNSMWVRGTLCHLIRKDIISGHFSDRDNFMLLSAKKGTPHHRDFLSLPLRLIVGCLLCHRVLTLGKIAEKTGLEIETVFENLLELCARGSLKCRLHLNGSAKQNIFCQLVSSSIIGPVVHPADLVDILKNVAGILVLFSLLDLKQFSEMIRTSVSGVQLAIYLISVHTSLNPRIQMTDSGKEIVSLFDVSIEPRLREDELTVLQAFLTNKLESEGSIDLKRFDMSVNQLFEEIVTLVLNGVLQCRFQNFVVTHQNSIKYQDFVKEPQLASMILGFLMKNTSFKMKELQNAFLIDTTALKNQLKILQSKNRLEFEKQKTIFTVKSCEPVFRSRGQLTKTELVVLGFFHMVRTISTKKAAFLLGISELQLKKTLYSLIGSGWLYVRIRDTGELTVSKRETLEQSAPHPSEYYYNLLNALNIGVIKLKDLERAFRRNSYVLLWELCFLVSQGFVKCRFLKDYDSVEVSQIYPIKQNKPSFLSCFSCGYKVLFEDKFCAHCGWKKRRCMVCQKLLEFGDQVKVCVYCGSL
ncbi:MAG: zinc ribbon domain-containing protein, partial [Candidatus Hodarchaeota archaeon]